MHILLAAMTKTEQFSICFVIFVQISSAISNDFTNEDYELEFFSETSNWEYNDTITEVNDTDRKSKWHYNDTTTEVDDTDRKSKFFGVGVVRFANTACTGNGNLDGTCYRRRQCADLDGTASGTCASGIGTCCVVYRTCSGSSSYNSTYFSNENFPATVTSSSRCIMTIERCNSNICQVRIDFLSFILAQPNATGYCTTDSFIVTGGASVVPVICGENTGQHIYVDFNGNDDIVMTITTGSSSLGRLWNFKVTQIACACPTRAPSGCLMFYNTTSDTVTSFNFGFGSNIIDSTTGLPGTRQIANENYGICVGMLAGYCSIQWALSTTGSFIVTGVPGAGFGALNNGDCTTDFVVIPNPYDTSGTAIGSDRFCGTDFNTVVTYSKPFVLTVVTNGNELNDVANIGFSLSFTQETCTNTDLLFG